MTEHERQDPGTFATVCVLEICAKTRTLSQRRAGHPTPVLLGGDSITSLPLAGGGPPIGTFPTEQWAETRFDLPEDWSLLLYTDGITEGGLGNGSDRLGDDGLRRLIADYLGREPDWRSDPHGLLAQLIIDAEELGGPPTTWRCSWWGRGRPRPANDQRRSRGGARSAPDPQAPYRALGRPLAGLLDRRSPHLRGARYRTGAGRQFHPLSSRRSLVLGQIAPAQIAALDLENALINEETAVRGFIITRRQRFLEPYRQGMVSEAPDYHQVITLLRGSDAPYAPAVEQVRVRAQAWQRTFVTAALGSARPTSAMDSTGKALFDAVRRSLARLGSALSHRGNLAHAQLNRAARLLTLSLLLAGALILVGLIGAVLLLRRIVTAPLGRLGREARRVAGGDFETPLAPLTGAREIVEVRREVETMRELIVSDLAAAKEGRARLEDQTLELQRSNADGDRIFRIFQRLHTKESYPGTGIGLALCRKIVEYHGGRIWLDRSYSGDTCIRFTLPMAKETAP
ncbi:MAG TPA: SpoIIE family protein phosphatase [Solirubrobacteraceae bacterium]|nr:SpoIIE family protein phosphatase [Solirubrobacteraceae bacterium]